MEIGHRIELVKLLPENSVAAEVGVAEGLFSYELLSAGVGKLYSVDNWEHISGVTGDGNFPQDFHDKNYQEAKERLSVFGERSIMLKGLSTVMAKMVPNDYLDLLYLDAAHYYDGVMRDLLAWYPKVKKGSLIAGHDYMNPDYEVAAAVKHFTDTIAKGCSVKTIMENNMRDASFYFIKP